MTMDTDSAGNVFTLISGGSVENLFKPEDFESVLFTKDERVDEQAAFAANAKFKEWAENCEAVKCNISNKNWSYYHPNPTHTARIFDIKKIETECSHESVRVCEIGFGGGSLTSEHKCNVCGKKLKPTGWTEVSE